MCLDVEDGSLQVSFLRGGCNLIITMLTSLSKLVETREVGEEEGNPEELGEAKGVVVHQRYGGSYHIVMVIGNESMGLINNGFGSLTWLLDDM